MFANPSDAVIREILAAPRRIAIVGCSPRPDRDSHRVAGALLARGHRIVPVYPGVDTILGQRCYGSLAEIPERIDMVDIFRRADTAGAVVDEAIAVGARIVWLQLGVIDTAAAERAAAAGLTVVMDRCPLIEYARLF